MLRRLSVTDYGTVGQAGTRMHGRMRFYSAVAVLVNVLPDR